jgi:hypothetical protein
MRDNDGTQLEALIALIEGRLAEGFKVERRKRVFEGGVQVAEFDITISGRIGSADCSWLIECRDRPSEGGAPAEWIEQLVGRRQRFHLSGVMAVSSTGFSPGAVSLAEREGIALRQLHSLTADAVTEWLPINAPLVVHDNQLVAARVFVEAGDSACEGGTLPIAPIDEKNFVEVVSGEAASLKEVWQKVVTAHKLWRDLPINGPARTVVLRAEDHIRERYRLQTGGGLLRVESIEFEAVLRAVVPKMPLVDAADYVTGQAPEDRETIARMGRWRLPGDGPIKELMIIGFLKRPEKPES